MPHATEEKLLKALIDIGKELAATVDLDELLQRLLQIARDVFAFENAIIRFYDPESRQLSTAASYGYPESATRIPLQLGQGIMGKVAATRMPLLIADLAAAADYVPGIEGARSELAVPMLVGERLIGVFNLESPRPNAFSPADIAPLLTVAGQAAIAIENARLYGSLRAVSARFEQLHHLNDSILNSASIGIYAVDDQLVVTSWNRRMEELSGMDENAALGRKLLALFPLLEEEGFGERLRRVLISGCPSSCVLPIVTFAARRVFRIAVSPLCRNRGQPSVLSFWSKTLLNFVNSSNNSVRAKNWPKSADFRPLWPMRSTIPWL